MIAYVKNDNQIEKDIVEQLTLFFDHQLYKKAQLSLANLSTEIIDRLASIGVDVDQGAKLDPDFGDFILTPFDSV